MDFGLVLDYRMVLLQGVVATVKIGVVAIIGSTVVGLVVAGIRSQHIPVLGAALRVYLEIFRGTPLWIQLVLVYFYIDAIDVSVFAAGAVGLTLYTGAYISEIFRSGIDAIPAGQAEAARVLGFSRLSTFGRIILPQSLKISLPALVGQHLSLIKDTSIVGVAIGYIELMKQGQAVITPNGYLASFPVWTAVAILYFVICYPLSIAVQRMEARVKVGS